LKLFLVSNTHSGSKVLHVTVPQAPSVAAAWQKPVPQLSHTPLQAELQHTLSTQLPLSHCEPAPHA
jgi:hypothetical protein